MRVAMLGNFPVDPEKIPGGVEAVIKNLALAMAAHDNVEVHILTCRPGLRQTERKRYKGIDIHYIPGQKRLGAVTAGFLDQRRLRAALATLRPDIVHGHGSGRYALAALSATAPSVVTLHGMKCKENQLNRGLTATLRRTCELRAERAVLRRSRHIFVIADYVRQAVSAATNARLYAIKNPVAGKLFEEAICDRSQTVLSVAAIQRRKGLIYLLRAFAQIAPRFPQAQLHFIGKVIDSDYERELRDFVCGQRLESAVRFIGFVSEQELLAEFTSCSLFALCSFEESSPVSIAEAMVFSKPVVATRVGGVPDLVDDGNTGRLVDYGDEAAIARALAELLGDTELRARMGAAARARADAEFRPEPVAVRTLDVYREIIAAEGEAA